MIFEWAIKNKLATISPTIGAKIPRRQVTVEKIERDAVAEQYLEKELKEFLAASREHGLFGDAEAFYLLVFSGMRSGELCAFK